MKTVDQAPFIHSFDTRRHAYRNLDQDRKSSEFLRLRDISRVQARVHSTPTVPITEGQRKAIKAAMKSNKIGVATGKVDSFGTIRVKLW
jgi:hypothetical protein